MDFNNFEQSQEQPRVKVRKRSNCEHRKKYPSFAQNVSEYFCEFCDKTSMHGFNLLAERKRTIPERIYWIIAIVLAIYLSVVLVNQAYKKWLNAPVVVTFARSQTPIWEIPFPAVTICPHVKTKVPRFDYTRIYLKKQNKEEVTLNETMGFDYMALLCDSKSEMLSGNHTTTDERAVEFLKKVAPDINYFLVDVQWLGKTLKGGNIKDLFSPVLTSDGVCYTFNMMERSQLLTDIVTSYGDDYLSKACEPWQWSLESGYSEDSDIFSSCPRRSLSSGAKGGLRLIFKAYSFDMDYICDTQSSGGFKVILHNPTEFPQADQGFFLVPLDQAVVAAVKPKIMGTSSDLNSYKPESRQCYFITEKTLKFFKIYNQQNCLVECLSNFTLRSCGCVAFHMPKENSTKICSAFKKDCIDEAKRAFLINEQNYKKRKLSKSLKENTNSETEKCNCLPSCTSLGFDFEHSQISWEWKEYSKVKILTPSWKEDIENVEALNNFAQLSQLTVFFKDMQFLTLERNELKGQLELWSDFGGLLGLFVGFTFISGFEVVYYLSLRLAFNVKFFGRRYWSGSEELLENKTKDENTELEEL